jgi:adenylate cyclase
MKNKWVRGLVIGAAVFVLVWVLSLVHVFDVWEWKAWDLRLRLFSDPSHADTNIVIFLIDQESLDTYEEQQGISWPWPREMYSYILQYCREGGVKAVFIDFIFSESSIYGVEDDQALSAAIEQSGNIFLPLSLSRIQKDGRENYPDFFNRFVLRENPFPQLPQNDLYPMQSVSLPVESLMRSAQGLGNTTFTQDKDGIYRRIPLLFTLNGLLVPSIPLALTLFLDDETGLARVPFDSSGQMVIRYHGTTGTYSSYSAAAIINSYAQLLEKKEPQIPPETFEGKTVFIGSSAPGILDLRSTPLSPVCPGVEVLATALDNLLQKDFVRIPPLYVFLFFLSFLCFFTSCGTSLLSKSWMTVLFGLFCIALPLVFVCLAFRWGYWLELIAPWFAVVVSFTSATLLNYSFEGRQRRFIKSAFRYYLSPHVIEKVLENPSLLRLGGEKRFISSFFSDVAGFTSISENLSPGELVHLLNDYLSEMTDIILALGGTLDKYEGDAVIAFWNAPLDQPDHAKRACLAALQCQKKLEESRPEFTAKFEHELHMRIGVNSGPAVVGNMGSYSRFDYTAMGDTVNLASRLEGACKHYGLPILVGETSFNMIKDDLLAREVDLIRVVGKSKPERIFQPIGKKGELSPASVDKIAAFQKALQLYRLREWDEALRLFKSLENDRLAQIYLGRAAALKKTPPPEDWSGVYELKEK